MKVSNRYILGLGNILKCWDFGFAKSNILMLGHVGERAPHMSLAIVLAIAILDGNEGKQSQP